MKVYVIRWFGAESYDPWSGVHKVFSTREGAEAYMEEKGAGPHSQDLGEGEWGYYLGSDIKEYEVAK